MRFTRVHYTVVCEAQSLQSHNTQTRTNAGTGPGPRTLTVGRLSEVTGGGVPGASRHHVTISDVTLASSLQSAALGAAGTRGSLPLSMPGGPRRSSAGALSAASSLTTTLTMGRGVWGQAAAAAARAALMVPTCKVRGRGRGKHTETRGRHPDLTRV